MQTFSNNSMFEVWQASNCERGSGCVNDQPDNEPAVYCPLLTVALTGGWPAEWPEVNDQPGDCTEYEEVVAYATDDEPADENPDDGYGENWRPVETVKGQEGLF